MPDFNPYAPLSFSRYFDIFYARVNDTGESFLRELTKDVPAVPFRSAGDSFRLIDNADEKSVLVRYGESETLLEQLRYAGPNRHLMRKLRRYVVNIHSRIAARMQDDGVLEEISPGILAQCCKSIYSESTGLNVFVEGFPMEDLVGV